MCRYLNEGPIRFETAHVQHKKIRQTHSRKEQKARTKCSQILEIQEFQSTHRLSTVSSLWTPHGRELQGWQQT